MFSCERQRKLDKIKESPHIMCYVVAYYTSILIHRPTTCVCCIICYSLGYKRLPFPVEHVKSFNNTLLYKSFRHVPIPSPGKMYIGLFVLGIKLNFALNTELRCSLDTWCIYVGYIKYTFLTYSHYI